MDPTDSQVVVLLNPGAARARRRGLHAAELAAFLAARGVAARVEEVGDDVAAAARRAVAGGPDLLVAAGGDGTVSAVAGAVAGSRTRLGVLPLGGFDHFASDLGVPRDLEAAADVLATGVPRRLDLVEVGGRPMVNNSILGFYPRAVRRRAGRGGGRLAKALRTLAAVVPTLRHPPFLRLRLHADGVERVRTSPFLFVGNNEYRMNLLTFAARPRIDDGRLFVHLLRASTRAALVRTLLVYAVADVRRSRDVESFSASRLAVECDRPELDVFVDGELHRLRTPLDYRVRVGALSVLAPAGEG